MRSKKKRLERFRAAVVRNWSMLLAGVVLLALGGALMFWLQEMMGRRKKGAEAEAMNQVVEPRVASRFASPSKEEAIEIVKQGLAVRDVEKVRDYFRTGSSSPEEVLEFLGKLEELDGSIREYKWLSSIDANGLLLDGVVLDCRKDDEPYARQVFLTPDETGKWRIDYESFARISRPGWKELHDGRADHGVLRAYIEADNYFNGPFKDEAEWVCYGMASTHDPAVFMGYCRRGSPQAKAMNQILKAGTEAPPSQRGPCRATVEIRRPTGAQNRQFEIVRVLAEDWVLSPKPFDEDAR